MAARGLEVGSAGCGGKGSANGCRDGGMALRVGARSLTWGQWAGVMKNEAMESGQRARKRDLRENIRKPHRSPKIITGQIPDTT